MNRTQVIFSNQSSSTFSLKESSCRIIAYLILCR